MPRDDAPLDAAVEAVARAIDPDALDGNPCWPAERRKHMALAIGKDAVGALRDLPDAEVWRLIGWLAEGREPTREMAAADPRRPIETAPRDGRTIDLWCGWRRWADHYWGRPDHECGEAGSYCDSDWHTAPPGWVDATFNVVVDNEPTHWSEIPGAMPAAAAPEEPSDA